ncbi:hypothetical protein [Klebsiella phage 05F01]|nr:hypothetical protein [Klebsiella phage 05F01]
MKIISGNIPNTSWMSFYDIENVDRKNNYVIENISSIPVRISINDESLSEMKFCPIIQPNEEFFIQKNLTSVRLLSDGNQLAKISIRIADASDIRVSLRKIDRLSDPRVLSQSLTQVEAASIEGRVFYSLIDINLAPAETKWFNFLTPIDKEIAVVNLEITPALTGFESKLYVNSSGMTNQNTYPIKSMNKFYGSSSLTINSLTSEPTTIGTLEDILLYVPLSGSNPSQRTASTSSRVQGYSIFNKNSNFQINLINTSGNQNRVVFKLYWLEAGTPIVES